MYSGCVQQNIAYCWPMLWELTSVEHNFLRLHQNTVVETAVVFMQQQQLLHVFIWCFLFFSLYLFFLLIFAPNLVKCVACFFCAVALYCFNMALECCYVTIMFGCCLLFYYLLSCYQFKKTKVIFMVLIILFLSITNFTIFIIKSIIIKNL